MARSRSKPTADEPSAAKPARKKRAPAVQAADPATPPAEAKPNLFGQAGQLWEAFGATRSEAVRLHLWVVTILGFLQPYAVGWFDGSDKLPSDPWQFYLTVLKTTAPLTIGLVLWACLFVLTAQYDSGGGHVMFMSLIGGLILTVAAQIGNALGAQHVEIVDYVGFAGPFNHLINALVAYLRAYRGALFLSSLAVASYAGYLTWRVLKNFAELEEKQAQSADDEQRRAA